MDKNMEKLVIFLCGLCLTFRCGMSETTSSCIIAVPQCPNPNVTFWLYTRGTEKNPQELSMNNEKSILTAKFVRGRPLVFLIHGYTGHRDYSPNTEIRPELLKNNDYNIISVDYRPLAEAPCYLEAVRNLRVVANCTAQLIDFIIERNLFKLDKIHVIGFSLGGQTSGMISNYLQTGRLKRITALDPAKPMFVTAQEKYKLNREDAEFVEVIHTDVFGRGILSPIGHVDFYVNGGVFQPGCRNRNAEGGLSAGSCNHLRAVEYYAESINSASGFWGYQCDTWYSYAFGMCQRNISVTSMAQMGFPVSKSTRGLYFVDTNSDKPFAIGQHYADESDRKSTNAFGYK